MAEFLEVVESIRQEEASVSRIFRGEGRSSASARGSRDPQYLSKLAEAATFLSEIYNGTRKIWQLQEALTTSDFPILFGDIIDRQILANYTEAPYSWRQYCRRAVVADFRTVRRMFINGAEGVLPTVGQQEEYPESAVVDGGYSYQVKKYGRKLPISWESIVNDDLQALRDIPERFGKAARRTEEKFATSLFVGPSGPLASFFTGGNGNTLTGNPALSINGLQAAITALLNQKDADGEPIMVDAMCLVVPPSQLVTARNIVNATEIRLNENGGNANSQLVGPSWAKDMVTVATNYYIPQVASTANGNTSWFLFSDPNTSRPAVEMGFLRGHETPEVFMKAPNAVKVGGGQVTEDFDTDSLVYKVRHVTGGSAMEPRAAVASNGSGS